MIVCEMTLADVHMAAEIEKMSFSTPWSEKSLENEFELDYAKYIAAKEGERLLGYAGIHNICMEGEITTVAVHPDFRGRGIASTILEKLIEIEKELGVEKINLEVRKSNETAIKLYEKFGFEVDGERKNYYSLPTENAVLMSLGLI